MMTHSTFNQNTKTNRAADLSAEASQQRTHGVGQMKGDIFRFGAILPVAAVMTTGLALTMAGLIATEFTPQDKTETASYEINPQVEDIPDVVRTLTLDPLREVDVPPPPPSVATVQTAAVVLPIREITGKKLDFVLTDLDFGDVFTSVPINKDPTPLVRVPPVFPNRFSQGNHSGYCRVSFDISPEGQPFNVSATRCTNKQLMGPTVKSVQRWKYAPKILNGRAVSRSGLETTVRFDLKDERGATLPIPTGF